VPCAKSEGLSSVTILADEPPGFVDKEKMAGGDEKSSPLPLPFGATMAGNGTTSESGSQPQPKRPPFSPRITQVTGNGFTHLLGGASRAFGFPQAAAKRIFAGRSPHPLSTVEVTKKLSGGSGRFCLGFDGFAVDENGAG
jgi:hypothetical protein